MNNSKYQIFFATNKNYFVPLAVAIRSLIDHADYIKIYEIYIATRLAEIDLETKNQILEMARSNISIEFVDSSLVDSRLNPNSKPKFKHISIDTFTRFYIDQLISADTYVLYLDVDILIQDDVSKIFEEAKSKEFLIACICVDPISDYFNAGVILFNIHRMVVEDKFREAIDYAAAKGIDDEATLNAIVKRKDRYYLDNRWNCSPSDASDLIWDPEEHSDLWSKHPDKSFAQALTEGFQNPGIIHYLGKQKPWNYQMRAKFPHQIVEQFYRDWWECYRRSPVYLATTYENYLKHYDETLENLRVEQAIVKKNERYKINRFIKRIYRTIWSKFQNYKH